jgi:phosphomannomutase/phosphoglucomutase
MIQKEIFRQYDIRGIVDDTLTDKAVKLIAGAYATYLTEATGNTGEKLKITIGRDIRLSSDRFFKILSEELNNKGIDVIELGVCPTPLLYFSIFILDNISGGIMITGSHNPPNYNGFKICVGKDTLHGDQIFELYKIIAKDGIIANAPEKGLTSKYDIIQKYVDFVSNSFSHIKSCFQDKIVLDAGNGVGNLVAPQLLRKLGFNVVELFSEPDGNFPNHHPDPTVESNLTALKETVLKEKALLGVGYDGDADRIGVLNEKGEILWGDQLLILFGRDILEKNNNAKIIGEVKCSQVLYDDIEKRGGIPIMSKTGHSLIKKKLKEEKAAVAGEMSGHIFFADRYFGFDDAIYATVRLVEILCKRKEKLSNLLSDLPVTYTTPEIRINCPDEKKFEIPEILKQKLLEDPEIKHKIRDIITIDGIRVIFDKGWGLVRASNTQPVLVLRFEGETPEARDFYRKKVEEHLKSLS